MKNTTLALLAAILLCWSCSDNIQLDIDNPSNNESSIVVDDQVFALPAKTTISMEVARGEHSIGLENDSTFQYAFDKDRYLINPTVTDYLIEKIYFSVSGNPTLEATFNRINRKTVIFAGYEIEGNYEVINDLIMEKNWHYKQRQPVPETITIENKKFSSAKTIRKLYSEDEFLQLLEDSNQP